jgi:hypothetical protein
MEEGNKFWVAIWKICALAFVGCIVSIGGCVYGQSNQVKQLILAGKDPILSMCAIHGTDGGRSAHCASALLVAK